MNLTPNPFAPACIMLSIENDLSDSDWLMSCGASLGIVYHVVKQWLFDMQCSIQARLTCIG